MKRLDWRRKTTYFLYSGECLLQVVSERTLRIDISMNTFAASRHLALSFPIQEWSENGSGRALVDYQLNFQPDASLFVLPKDYRRFTVQEFREGKVVQPQ